MGEFGGSLLASHFEVLFDKKLTSQAFFKSGIMKMSIDGFPLCFYFFV